MKNYFKKFLLFVAVILSSSCAPYGGQLRYRFKFINNSDKDLYIIVDNKTDEPEISPESIYDFVYANNWKYIENKKPWTEVIKDDAYVYILDASLINLLPLEGYLTEEKRSPIL